MRRTQLIPTQPKTLIHYHRSYRKITGSAWKFLALWLAVSLPLFLLVLFYHSNLTAWISLGVKTVLASQDPSRDLEITQVPFLWNDVHFVKIAGKDPSRLSAIINAIFSAAMIFFLLRIRKGKNIAIYFVFLFGFNLASALFFLIFPNDFPYTASQFSELYMESQISMWLFIPFLLGMAFMTLPGSLSLKVLLILATLGYSVGFSALRYIVFLWVIHTFSSIYMALLFFAFGPLIDFVYIVGAYSIYNRKLALQLRGNRSVWKWSY